MGNKYVKMKVLASGEQGKFGANKKGAKKNFNFVPEMFFSST